jgi:antitoxin YefM
METINFTEARNNSQAVLDRAIENADFTLIKRRDAEDAVVMSLDAFNSLMETVHLLRSPANAAHLARSIDQYRAGDVQERDIVGE